MAEKAPTRQLPPQVIALVQHVELNKAGWWEKSIDQQISAVLWILDEPLTIPELQSALAEELGSNILAETIDQHIGKLLEDGSIIDTGDGAYKLTESSRNNFEARLRRDEEVSAQVKDKFKGLVNAASPAMSADDAWQYFLDELLGPMIRELGARTFDFITGVGVEAIPPIQLDRYLNHFEAKDRHAAQATIVGFLDPHDALVREYVLRHLTTYFLVEAASMSAETLNEIERITSTKPTFKIILDTNFIFSFLRLHDNPANEAADALIQLANQLAEHIDVTLYVLPRTLQEAKSVLVNYEFNLSGVILAKNVVGATSSVKFSGITEKYFEVARSGRTPQTAQEYFGTYINNLLGLLRERGVELLNEDTSALVTDQRVINDLMSQLAFEEKTRGERAKKYEAMEHDVILWHVARKRRPPWVESPLEAVFWAATLDYRLLGFDAYKARRYNQLPVCLHPTAIVQMLQFWVPRSTEMEAALMSNLRLPFLFYEFDPEMERAVLSILRTISKFENVEGLSERAISNMFVNEGLRKRMITEQEDGQITLVRDAIIEEERKARAELDSMTARAQQLETELAEEHSESELLRAQAGQSKSEAERLANELTSRDSDLRRLHDEQASADRRTADLSRQLDNTRFYVTVLMPTIVASIVIGFIVGAVVHDVSKLATFWSFLFSYVVVLSLGEEYIRFRARHLLAASNEKLWVLAGRIRSYIGGAFVAVVLSAAGSALWDWIKGRRS